MSHAAEGGLEQGGPGDAATAFGDSGLSFPPARFLDPGIGAEEGLQAPGGLAFATAEVFGCDEGQDGRGGFFSESGDAFCQLYGLIIDAS